MTDRCRAFRLLVAALLTTAGCSTESPDSARIAERIRHIETGLLSPVYVEGRQYSPTTIPQEMKANSIPAVSIAVVHEGRIEWSKAYGLADVESGRAATETTLFQAASISKAVASTAALTLVAEGKLTLDEDVNTKLRSWHLPPNELTRKAPVTLRRLLTHTAGLTVHGFPGYEPGQPVPTVVQILEGQPPSNTEAVRVDIEPGTTRRYSGGGILLMQLLMTDVTGQAFPALMRDRVLTPIGMNASTFEQPLPASRGVEAATGYKVDGTPWPGRYRTQPEMAAAGLWTTPSDLARWIIEVQHAVSGTSGVLPKHIAAMMVTPDLGNAGLGVALEGADQELRFRHGGANYGFRTDLVGFVRRGEGMVVMTNSDAGDAVIGKIEEAIAREYGWPGFERKRIIPIPIAEQQLEEYTGRYQLAERSLQVIVSLDSGKVMMTLPNGQQIEIVPTGTDAFATTVGGGTVTFERDDTGKVIALHAGPERAHRIE